jgi:DNA-binding SARP family transcriptional activator
MEGDLGKDTFQLDLLGSFRLVDPNGHRILLASKRSRVLLAMLATSRLGERSRRWLQERLWGSRDRCNAQASLRRELSNLRRLLNSERGNLLIIEREAVLLDLDMIVVDVRDPARVASSRDDFLEGVDIACEEEFEDWLREERQSITAARERNLFVQPTPQRRSSDVPRRAVS